MSMEFTKNHSEKLNETLYSGVHKSGLRVYVMPKKGYSKSYAIIGTHFGSIDNKFIAPGETVPTILPDGIAHFLEHKLFEQPDGGNVFAEYAKYGANANAYTSFNMTGYLFECTSHVKENLEILLDFVCKPYFTDENIEKEQGIIGQEIKMYDDDADWRCMMNFLEAMYVNHPVNRDIAGTVESISEITPEILYNCCETFYNPANMAMVVCGDFVPEELLEEIKKRITKHENGGDIKRIYTPEETEINEKEKIVNMDVNNPLFTIGFLDKPNKENIVKRHIQVEILLEMLFGKSSELYRKLYSEGLLLNEPDLDYEFTKNYAHVLITGQSNNPQKVIDELKIAIQNIKNQGINEELFIRTKKKIYGRYITDYNSVSSIGRMFLSDYFKGINSFNYLEEYKQVTKEAVEQILKEVFDENKMVISIVDKIKN